MLDCNSVKSVNNLGSLDYNLAKSDCMMEMSGSTKDSLDCTTDLLVNMMATSDCSLVMLENTQDSLDCMMDLWESSRDSVVCYHRTLQVSLVYTTAKSANSWVTWLL